MNPWIKLRYIYKDVDIETNDEFLEQYQRDQLDEDIENAPTVIKDRWELRRAFEGVMEAYDSFNRPDVYIITVFGKAPFHAIIEDITKFLEEVGPTNARSENI